VGDGLVLLKELPDSEHLHSLQAANVIRASINVMSGIVAGIAVVKHDQPMVYMTAPSTNPICVPGVPGCDPYAILNFLGVYYSGEPAENMACVLYELEPGFKRTFARGVIGVSEEAGPSRVAGAHLFGRGRYHAIVEVLSDDAQSFYETLLGVTDLEGVRSSHILHIDAADVRGKGSTRVSGTA
jgi:hypothetical protein